MNECEKHTGIFADFMIMTGMIGAVALSILGVRALLGYRGEGEDTPVLYTVRIRELDEELADKIREGDELLCTNNKRTVGRVEQVRKTPSVKEVYSEEEGTMVCSAVPGKCDIELTVSARCRRDGGIYVSGVRLCAGESLSLRAPDLAFVAEIGQITL